MAPEYALHGHFSVKSDVFSFGVLVLEIVSGRKNLETHHEEDSESEILITHVSDFHAREFLQPIHTHTNREVSTLAMPWRAIKWTFQVWRSWQEGKIPNIVDPLVSSGYTADILRCIHIGLLCVQENVTNRPTMASISLMLNSQSVTLPVPTQPAFLMNSSYATEISSTLNSTSQASQGDHTGNNTGTYSVNEVSVTEPYPR